jgi:hypothetical protein
MTLSSPFTNRLGVFALALIYTGLTFGAAVSPTPALAQSGAYYTAELVAPAKDDRLVASGVAWKCVDTTCRAKKGTSRPTTICRGLARKFGEVSSFTFNGEELAAERLAKCNGN